MNAHVFPRRDFLKTTARAALAASTISVGLAAERAPAAAGPVPKRPLGKTGVSVSLLGLGGHHIGIQRDAAESVRLIHAALDAGVTFLDNAWEYNRGESERRMGEAIHDRRDRVFLMTKVCARDAQGAMANLEESLRRLQTDHLDLWQFHECNYDNDPDLIFAKGGAIEAAVAAKKQGKVRFIGFTGHKSPQIHLKMLAQDFPWDAAQMPINVLDAQYRSFQTQVVPVLVQRGIGVIAMKTFGGTGRMIKDGIVTPQEALSFVYGLPVSVAISGMDTMEVLEQNLEIVRGFQPMSDAARAALRHRTLAVAGDGRYELFKSTQAFDSGVHRKQHGFA